MTTPSTLFPTRCLLLLALILTLSLTAQAESNTEGIRLTVEIDGDGLEIDAPLSPYSPKYDRDRPWTWTFAPFGTIHGWQHTESHPTSTWDYGTTMHVQFGRGRGHAVWFGVAYRQAAGFDDNATITAFDPRHIDSAQLLTWRFQLARRHTVFTHLERWCYHEIDVRAPTNPFWTHTSFGYGSVSPAEAWGMGLRRAYHTGKPWLDYYIHAGPIVHGGPADILGNWPRWQGKGRTWAALAIPVTGMFLLEAQLSWELLLLRESDDARWRHKGDARLTAMVQRRHGAVTLFTGYRIHDDTPYRGTPSSLYIGIGYRI